MSPQPLFGLQGSSARGLRRPALALAVLAHVQHVSRCVLRLPMRRSITCFLLRCQHAWRPQNATAGVPLRRSAPSATLFLSWSVGGTGTPDNCYRFHLELLRVPRLTVYLPGLFNDFDIPACSAWDIITVGSNASRSAVPAGWLMQGPVATSRRLQCKRRHRLLGCESTSYMSVVIFTFVQTSVWSLTKNLFFLHLLRSTPRRTTRPQVLFRQHHPYTSDCTTITFVFAYFSAVRSHREVTMM